MQHWSNAFTPAHLSCAWSEAALALREASGQETIQLGSGGALLIDSLGIEVSAWRDVKEPFRLDLGTSRICEARAIKYVGEEKLGAQNSTESHEKPGKPYSHFSPKILF